jgi:hypothetical protein
MKPPASRLHCTFQRILRFCSRSLTKGLSLAPFSVAHILLLLLPHPLASDVLMQIHIYSICLTVCAI